MTRVVRVRRSRLRPGAILMVLVFALGAVACLPHDGDMDHQHHVMPPDLCLGFLVASFSLIVLARPLVAGWAPVLPLAPAYATTLHILEPPPKSRSLA